MRSFVGILAFGAFILVVCLSYLGTPSVSADDAKAPTLEEQILRAEKLRSVFDGGK